ncbi:unnamed protein product, partial [Vitis vinifera]
MECSHFCYSHFCQERKWWQHQIFILLSDLSQLYL